MEFAMNVTRRLICSSVTAIAAAVATTQRGFAIPGSSSIANIDSLWLLAQLQAPPPPKFAPPPTPEDLSEPKRFEAYLHTRFKIRTDQSGVFLDGDAMPSFQEIVSAAAKAAFEDQRRGAINKSRDYLVLPLAIRRPIIVRNFDTLTDVLVIAAFNEGKKITRAIINSARDFVCPMFPFCTA
jgi:hypothetical protein